LSALPLRITLAAGLLAWPRDPVLYFITTRILSPVLAPEWELIRSGKVVATPSPCSVGTDFVPDLRVIKSSMAKSLIQSVVKQLHQERTRLEDELHRVTAALTTFGRVYMQGGKRGAAATTTKKRTISPAGRKRIAAAQRARWAKVRAGKAGKKTKA
jgi:hypothetical protein